ncbi:MAG: carboxypeptidase-like regulatory domain-containing protein [bacterium]
MTLSNPGIRLACFVVALAGCADDLTVREPPETPPAGSERATVAGRVVDADGVAVPGAAIAVRATGEHATADANGGFTLDVPANTTLTIATTSPGMAPTLLPQLLVSPGTSAQITIPLVTTARLTSLSGLGPNPMGGVVAITVQSASGAPAGSGSSTIELTPSNLGKVFYAPEAPGMPDPDPSLTSMGPGSDCIAWALGVQPHVSIMSLTLHGSSQLEPPFAIDDITWPGTFTVDAGALTLVTLFTP